MVVARCEAADGKPAASIQWLGGGPEGPPEGPRTNASLPGAEGTTTVVSEYRLVPTATDHGRQLTCMVVQRTQAEPWVGAVTLSVECKGHTRARTHAHAETHAHTHTRTRTHVHARTHTHACISVNMHTRVNST